MSSIVIVDGKSIDRKKFEPRVRACVKCNPQGDWRKNCPYAKPILSKPEAEDGKKAKAVKKEDSFQCGVFGWEINVSIGKHDAPCSRKTQGQNFSARLSDAEVTKEQAEKALFLTDEELAAKKKAEKEAAKKKSKSQKVTKSHEHKKKSLESDI